MNNNTNTPDNNIPKKKNHSCLITIGVVILFALIFFGIIFLLNYTQDNDNNNGASGTHRPLSRNATLNDITVTGDDLDLASFGEKLTFTPKKDIDGLKLKFIFQKSNGTQLQTIEKSLGNVKEGQQYSITISLFELSWDVIKNTADLQCKYTVSAGTISYFA